jgi:hypothetical protein
MERALVDGGRAPGVFAADMMCCVCVCVCAADDEWSGVDVIFRTGERERAPDVYWATSGGAQRWW